MSKFEKLYCWLLDKLGIEHSRCVKCEKIRPNFGIKSGNYVNQIATCPKCLKKEIK